MVSFTYHFIASCQFSSFFIITFLLFFSTNHEIGVFGQHQQNNDSKAAQQTNHQTGQQQQNQTIVNANNITNTTGNHNGTNPIGGTNNQTNSTSNLPSSTPITFPLAPLPSTGALAGTYQAPFPASGDGGGGGGGNGQALGPDDNYIASALRLLPKPLLSIKFLCIYVLVIFAGAFLL